MQRHCYVKDNMVYLKDEGVYNRFKHSYNKVIFHNEDEPFATNVPVPAGASPHDLQSCSYPRDTLCLQPHSRPLIASTTPTTPLTFHAYLQQLPSWEQDYLTNVKWLCPLNECLNLVLAIDTLCATDGSVDTGWNAL